MNGYYAQDSRNTQLGIPTLSPFQMSYRLVRVEGSYALTKCKVFS